jgi:hypothetical protein
MSQTGPASGVPMKFVGVDLTSAFAASPRPIDIAVLDQGLNANFYFMEWPDAETVTNRNATFTNTIFNQIRKDNERIIIAIDGPQGLAVDGNNIRTCERILNAPGRTPSVLPPPAENGMPFHGFIRSSIDFFAGMINSNPQRHLAGLNGVERIDADLFEVFPGSEWAVLANRKLPKKTTIDGRVQRLALFQNLHINFLNADIPTPDQNDALIGAYLAWCVHNRETTVDLVGVPPTQTNDDEIREGFILHANSSVSEMAINTPCLTLNQD